MTERAAGKPAMTARDRNLLIGFAFFAEIVLGWFLLVDPAMTRLARLNGQLAQAREALGVLQAAAPSAQPSGEGAGEALPPPLRVVDKESAALLIQRHVAEQAAAAGVQPLAVSVVARVETDPPATRWVDVAVTGDYDGIERFVGRLAWPDAREGMTRLTVAPYGEGGSQVRADVRMLVALAGVTDDEPSPGPSAAP